MGGGGIEQKHHPHPNNDKIVKKSLATVHFLNFIYLTWNNISNICDHLMGKLIALLFLHWKITEISWEQVFFKLGIKEKQTKKSKTYNKTNLK